MEKARKFLNIMDENIRWATHHKGYFATEGPMKALSIRQPWAWLIAQGIKDVENRTWATKYRGSFLIHASKNFDKKAFDIMMSNRCIPGLFCKCDMPKNEKDFETGGIVGIAFITDVLQKSHLFWHEQGKHGFVIQKARAVEFIELPGRLGFFDVPIKGSDLTLKKKMERIV